MELGLLEISLGRSAMELGLLEINLRSSAMEISLGCYTKEISHMKIGPGQFGYGAQPSSDRPWEVAFGG